MSFAGRGLDSYRQTQAQSRTPVELVVMLYDGALRFLATARAAIERRDIPARREALSRTLAIISEHCPFGDAAVQHPVICAVDRGIVRGMLAGLYGETVPHTDASRPQGDEVCVTSL